MINLNQSEPIPIACDLTALPLVAREQHISDGLQIFQASREVQELPDGYAFRFDNQPGVFMALANFVENERRCCAFFAFVLEVVPEGGPLWLRLTGGEGVKEFVYALFGDANHALLAATLTGTLAQTSPIAEEAT